MIDETTLPPVHAVPPIIEHDPAAVLDQLAPRIRLLQDEIGQGHCRPGGSHPGGALRAVRAGPLPAGGRARAGQDAAGARRWRSSLELGFSRIQFTPDLMPSDITGTEILEEDASDTRHRRFVFARGPVFTQVLLADEINRTPPKTQAALAGGDAGEDRDGRGQDLSAGGAVHGAGDAESDRAGRDLPVARSAARPLPVRGAGGLSHAGRGEQGGGAAFLRAAGAAAAGADARGGAELPQRHRAGAGGAQRD